MLEINDTVKIGKKRQRAILITQGLNVKKAHDLKKAQIRSGYLSVQSKILLNQPIPYIEIMSVSFFIGFSFYGSIVN